MKSVKIQKLCLTFIEWCEFEVWQIFAKLCIACGLLEHTVCFTFIKLELTGYGNNMKLP